MGQSRAWETGRPGMSYIYMKNHSPDGLLRNQMVSLRLASKSYLKQLEIIRI